MQQTRTPSARRVRRLQAVSEAQLHGLSELLIDCVAGGASVSFMDPLPLPRHGVLARGGRSGRRGRARPAGGRGCAGIVGSVQLVLAQPDNQPHRADLSKMLVLRRARRQGWGEALMQAAEQVARDCGKSLLVLDTASESAERLYARLGWQRAGVIPGYALLPKGGLCATTIFYRALGPLQGA